MWHLPARRRSLGRVAVVAVVLALTWATTEAKKRRKAKTSSSAAETTSSSSSSGQGHARTQTQRHRDGLVPSEENEYTLVCSTCYRMAHHAHRALRFNVERRAAPTMDGWKRVLKAGCADLKSSRDEDDASPAGKDDDDDAVVLRSKGESLCRKLLVDIHGGAMAQELADLLEDADGDASDSSIADPDKIVEALCAPDSITRACPSSFKVVRKTPKHDESGKLPAEVAVWNSANVPIELHLITTKDAPDECSASELDGADIMSPLARVVEPNKEKVVAVGTEKADDFLQARPDARDPRRQRDHRGGEDTGDATASAAPPKPAIRVKPQGSPCGAGFDVVVDASVAYSLYRVLDAGVYQKILDSRGADGAAYPSVRDAAPLVAVRLYHNDHHDDLFGARSSHTASSSVAADAAKADL